MDSYNWCNMGCKCRVVYNRNSKSNYVVYSWSDRYNNVERVIYNIKCSWNGGKNNMVGLMWSEWPSYGKEVDFTDERYMKNSWCYFWCWWLD